MGVLSYNGYMERLLSNPFVFIFFALTFPFWAVVIPPICVIGMIWVLFADWIDNIKAKRKGLKPIPMTGFSNWGPGGGKGDPALMCDPAFVKDPAVYNDPALRYDPAVFGQ